MIHRFPTLYLLFFDRSNYEHGDWAEALRENGVANGRWECISVDWSDDG